MSKFDKHNKYTSFIEKTTTYIITIFYKNSQHSCKHVLYLLKRMTQRKNLKKYFFNRYLQPKAFCLFPCSSKCFYNFILAFLSNKVCVYKIF